MKDDSSLPRAGSSARLETISIVLLFILGIGLRLRQYLSGRSLWVDEAMLALNIVNRDFGGLLEPLDYDQGAPAGFLLIEKVFNLLFGRNEYSLRLFPLLAGLFSLWIFYLLLRRFTSGTSLLIAFALFAVNPRLIYYSSEVKQYIVDVAVTVTLLLIAVRLFERPSRMRLGLLAASGLLALWLSHPAVFVLGGIGLALLLMYFQKRDYANLGLTAGMGISWLVNVGLLYSLTLRELRGNSYMREYWQAAFAPMPPWVDWNWFISSFNQNADTHFAVTAAPWLLLVVMLAGWIILLRQTRYSGIAIGGVFLLALFASFLELYPSLERMVLFLLPVGLLLIGKALEAVTQRLRGYPLASVLVLFALGGCLLYGPVTRTEELYTSSRYFENIRPTMDYLKWAWREGDQLHLTYGAVAAFEYYAPMYRLDVGSYIPGRREDYGNPDAMLERLTPLQGNRRVWVLMSHVYEKGNFNEREFLLDHFSQVGKQEGGFHESGTSVFLYLFDLGE